MPALITGIFGFLADFFRRFIIDGALRIASVTTIISLNLMFFVAFLAGLLSIATILFFIFNKINEFFAFIDSLIGGGGDDILTTALKILSNFGLFRAFNDIFNLFSPVIIAIFVYYFSKLLWVALFHLRNSVLAVIISSK